MNLAVKTYIPTSRKARPWQDDVPFPSDGSFTEGSRAAQKEDEETRRRRRSRARREGRAANVALLHAAWARCGDAFAPAPGTLPVNWNTRKPVSRCLSELQHRSPGRRAAWNDGDDEEPVISSPGTSEGSWDESPDTSIVRRQRSRKRRRAGSQAAEPRPGGAQAAGGYGPLGPAADCIDEIESVESDDALPVDSDPERSRRSVHSRTLRPSAISQYGAAVSIAQFASDDDDDNYDGGGGGGGGGGGEVEAEARGGRAVPASSFSADLPRYRGRSVSEWVEMLMTPEKGEGGEAVALPELQNSAGKKRFLRGGLAERALRLQCREKSSIVFWRHHRAYRSAAPSTVPADAEEKQENQEEGATATLKLRVLTRHEECSLIVTSCELTSPRHALFPSSSAAATAAAAASNSEAGAGEPTGESAGAVSRSPSPAAPPPPRVPNPGPAAASPRDRPRDGPDAGSTGEEGAARRGGDAREDAGEPGGARGSPRTRDGNTVLALFARDAAKELKLRPGDTVAVRPPWLKLWLSSECGDRLPVVLCTRFAENLGGGGGANCGASDPPRLLPRLSHSLGLTVSWRGVGSQVDTAPALVSGLFLGPHGASDSLLEALEWQSGAVGPGGDATLCVRAVVQRVYHTRAATALTATDTTTASTLVLPRRSRATPVNRTRTQGPGAATEPGCVLLLQDACGVFAELRAEAGALPPGPSSDPPGTDGTGGTGGQTNSQPPPPPLPSHLEGCSCLFAGVAVLRRTTRTRSPALFSLIDSLWPPRQNPKVQPGSPHSSEESAATTPVPSFCYVLVTHPGSVVRPLSDAGASALYRPPAVLPLSRTLVPRKGDRVSWRCSFYATLIYAQIEEGGRGEVVSGSLFVTDDSLQSASSSFSSSSSSWPWPPPRSARVLVTAACVLPAPVRAELRAARVASLLFRDVVFENDRLVATEGSLILLANRATAKPTAGAAHVEMMTTEAPESQREEEAEDEGEGEKGEEEVAGGVPSWETPLLDWLSPTSRENSLCLVQGVIVDVDEENAVCWMTCERCGSEQLEKTRNFSGEVLRCVPCDAIALQPVCRMVLSVLLSCPALGAGRSANLKLLEPTISKLLPARLSLFEEGYDPETLLGRPLGPLPCLLRSAPAWLAAPCQLSEVALFGVV